MPRWPPCSCRLCLTPAPRRHCRSSTSAATGAHTCFLSSPYVRPCVVTYRYSMPNHDTINITPGHCLSLVQRGGSTVRIQPLPQLWRTSTPLPSTTSATTLPSASLEVQFQSVFKLFLLCQLLCGVTTARGVRAFGSNNQPSISD